MKKLPAMIIGLTLIASSCVPAAAPDRLTETSQPTALPTATVEVKEPTATATTQLLSEEEPAATATTQALTQEDIVAPTPSGKSFQPQLGEVSVDMNEVVALLPPDAIPAVLPDSVPEIMVSAADADAGGIDENVQVIGVSINGENRAYPIPFLSRHEIINDEVGGRLIAATW